MNGQDVSNAGHNAVVAAITEGTSVARKLTKTAVDNGLCNSFDDNTPGTPFRKSASFSWEDDIYSATPKQSTSSSPLMERNGTQMRRSAITADSSENTLHTDLRDLELLKELQSSPPGRENKGNGFVSITVAIGGLDQNVRYAFESAGGSKISVLETMSESKYCFKVPIEVSLSIEASSLY